MRNLTFITTPNLADQAACFRRAFMEKTAVWHVAIFECDSTAKAETVLQGKEHAFVVAPVFRSILYDAGRAKGASAKLSQGSDVLYRGGSQTITLAQLGRSVVDCIEELFIPLYGARVVILGSGSAALDLAYECSRAGVDEITLLDSDKERVQDNLSTFLEAFDRNRTSILDTEQARLGHLSANRAYEHTSFRYGSLRALSSIRQADLVFSFLPESVVVPDYRDALKPSQIVCDPWGRSSSLLTQATEVGCDVVLWRSVMTFWGTACADLLIEFGNAGLK